MAQATGSRSYLAHVTEVTPGTTPASPSLVSIPFQSTTLNTSRGLVSDPSLRSDRMKRFSRLGNRAVGGNLVVSYAPATFDDWLEAAMRGTWSTNVLKVGSTAKHFTVEVGHPDIAQYRVFRGVTVNSFTLNVPAGNSLVTAEMELIGMDGVIAGTSVDGTGPDAPAAGDPFVHLDATFNEGGTSIGYLTGVQVKIENAAQANYAAGASGARSITAGMSSVTGQITAYFESAALFTKWYAETDSSLSFTLVSGANSQIWSMPKVNYTASTIPVSGDGPIIQTLTFEALYDGTSGSTLTITRA